VGILEAATDKAILRKRRFSKAEADKLENKLREQIERKEKADEQRRLQAGRKKGEDYPVLTDRKLRAISENEVFVDDDESGRPGMEQLPFVGQGVGIEFWERAMGLQG
jgi:hypothetical protein